MRFSDLGQRGQMIVDGLQPGAHGVDRDVRRARLRPLARVDRPPHRRRRANPRDPPCRSSRDPAPPRRPRLRRRRGRRRARVPVPSSGTIRRPAGRRACNPGADAAPTHTGIGRCTGSGAIPAPVTVWKSPSKVTDCSVQSRRSRSICSADLLPRLPKSSPSASYSTAFQPTPMPRRNRPPLSRSTSAACFATNVVWRCGRMMTPVTSSSDRVTAAR